MNKRKKKKRLTKNQIEYNKQVKRIKAFIRRKEKLGFIWSDDEKKKILPERPKRITKNQIEKLKNIKPAKLYNSAEFVNFDTGEILTAQQGKQITKERNKALKTAYISEGELVYNWFQNNISNAPDNIQLKLNKILNNAIQKNGRNNTLKNMANNSQEVINLSTITIYYSDKIDAVQDALVHLSSIISNDPLSLEEMQSFNDDLEELYGEE